MVAMETKLMYQVLRGRCCVFQVENKYIYINSSWVLQSCGSHGVILVISIINLWLHVYVIRSNTRSRVLNDANWNIRTLINYCLEQGKNNSLNLTTNVNYINIFNYVNFICQVLETFVILGVLWTDNGRYMAKGERI